MRVWRYRDEDNYYIVRANALEENVALYKVLNGERPDLPLKGPGRTYGMKEKVPSKQWSTLRVTAKGNLFHVYHDGKKLYEVEDDTFKEAGKVGVWSKADSVIYFDDLRIAVYWATASGTGSVVQTVVACARPLLAAHRVPRPLYIERATNSTNSPGALFPAPAGPAKVPIREIHMCI